MSRSLIFLLLIAACHLPPVEQKGVVMLSKNAGQQAIVKDEHDHFFELINSLDMRIQMRVADTSLSREALLVRYKIHLQEDVQDFTPDEVSMMNGIFRKAFLAVRKISPKIDFPEIHLIKIGGNHFGLSAFYTRDNCILIPGKQIQHGGTSNLTEVMLHELFHVWSRYHPAKRDKLYNLLGFQRLESLGYSDFLQHRRMLNPDGVDCNWAINVVKGDKQTALAVPVTYSRYADWKPEFPSFFAHLHFQLFEIEAAGASHWKISSANTGIDLKDVKNFFEQVGLNTTYTIHPDEILADNFAILAFSKSNEAVLEKLTPAGIQLLKRIEKIITE